MCFRRMGPKYQRKYASAAEQTLTCYPCISTSCLFVALFLRTCVWCIVPQKRGFCLSCFTTLCITAQVPAGNPVCGYRRVGKRQVGWGWAVPPCIHW